MLKLQSISKNYLAGASEVKALKDIDISFRNTEFVAILGPSGCGKTTLLNIVGGLDRYTSGDLNINGRSTKDFKDSDWDAYRNHSIGFVFQSYNLIPHQSVLSNVELALTLSGVSKSERRKRAIEALTKVGLADQIKKKPNQMSGGQMQRVAIARALVNNPDILLADEPTGALDSETSIQVMELLKEISQEKLVIMVTHNPELAQTYSTRTVSLLDGKIINDSDPYEPDTEELQLKPQTKKRKGKNKAKKPSMSFFTALSLSLNNLMTKKGRTFLTSFAGSIGIIGIALIMSLSNGIQIYIDSVQQDTLASYPLTIEAETMDMNAILENLTGIGNKEISHGLDAVYSNSVMYELLNTMSNIQTKKNNLKDFKQYLEESDSDGINQYISAIQYSYDLDMSIYVKDEDGNIIKSDIETLMNDLYGMDMSSQSSSDNDNPISYFSNMAGTSSMYSTFDTWQEMLSGDGDELINPLLRDQYELLYGNWPSSYDEIILVVDKNNEISDMCLYALGLKSVEEMREVMMAYVKGEEIETPEESWTYEEICDMSFKLIPSASFYRFDSKTKSYHDLSETQTGLSYLYDNGIDLKISGIVRPDEEAISSMMNSGSIGYTSALTDYVIEQGASSEVLKAQLKDESIDVFSNLPFAGNTELTSEEKADKAKEYISSEDRDNTEIADVYTAFMSVPDDTFVTENTQKAMEGITREYIQEVMLKNYSAETGMSEEELNDYIESMDDEELFSYVEEITAQSIIEEYSQATKQQLSAYTSDQLAFMMLSELPKLTQDQLVSIYENHMPSAFSESTLEENLKKLGYVDKNSPSVINIYADTFEAKDFIAECINDYNDKASQEDKISYTDYAALMMSSITTIINAISYVLIAFVAISLIVSSIMIGIITYISVLERTKEIGILRSIGASKRDISRVFNAETLIVGITAGIIGILMTLVLCIPINIIIHKLTDIMAINAVLPWLGGVLLVLISMFLTLISGLIPARLAAKKDPVVALRTE